METVDDLLVRSRRFLRKGWLNRAWVEANGFRAHAPKRPEGYLLMAEINERKAALTGNPGFHSDTADCIEKALARGARRSIWPRRLQQARKKALAAPPKHVVLDCLLGEEPLRVLDSQVGYHCRGVKSILLWSKQDRGEGRFRLRRIGGGVVLTRPLERWGWEKWGRFCYRADFSDFTTPGRFRIEAVTADGTRARSRAFRIDRSLYRRLTRKALFGFKLRRCGHEVKGWKPACHLDDAPIRDDKGNVVKWLDARGGWHGGGAGFKEPWQSAFGLYPLLTLHQLDGSPARGRGGRLPPLLDECLWELDFLRRIQADDGAIPKGVSSRLLGYAAHEEAVEREVSMEDPRTGFLWATMAWLYASAAKFAWLVRPVRADLSEAYAAFAQRVKRKYFEDSPQTILSAHGGFLVGDIYSFLCGGRSEDWRQSQARVRKILGFQNRKGYFRIEGLELNHRHVVPFLYVQALWEFARLFPQEPLAGKVRDALARFMATVERLTSLSSFGHMADYSDAVSPLLIPRAYAGHGLNSYYAGTANVCLLVGDLLGTRRFVPVAERQMQWVFGRNPCGVCSMGGEGYRRGLLHDITLFYQGKERSTLPGVVPLGISGGDGVAYPLDYPKCSNRPVEGERDGYSVAWSNGEPAYFVMGPVCLALGLLSQRLR